MEEHNAREPASFDAAQRSPELESEHSGLSDDPPQRWSVEERACLLHHEKIRVIALGLALLTLLAGFFLYLLSGNTLPLFGTMVIALLGYTGLDAWLNRYELV